jgi:hypothetical protein
MLHSWSIENLGGWCSLRKNWYSHLLIRTELLAHSEINIAVKIEKLLLSLEGNGKRLTPFNIKENMCVDNPLADI